MRTPTKRQEDRAKKVEIQNEKERQVNQLLSDYNKTFSSSHGMRVLNDIMKICDFGITKVKANTTGKIDTDLCLYAAAREGVYLEIRKKIKSTILKEVEYV